MKAYLIDLTKIEVSLSKEYYQGYSPNFYLRNLNTNTISKLLLSSTKEDNEYCYYYFENALVDLVHSYQVVDNYGLSENLVYTKLVLLDNFDQLFYYDGNDLGATYHYNHTIFKVWAPTALNVMVSIEKDGYTNSFQMIKTTKGVFSIDLNGDFDNCKYNYLVKHHNSYIETVDPYAYASTSNSLASMVINVEKLDKKLNKHILKPMKKTDAIIYEASVRDFTMHPSVEVVNRGKFLGMVEEFKTNQGNLAGVDYLVDLGITHLQLMPIFDFSTVDENNSELIYNWGYDPSQYNVPEGSYATNPNDGYNRVTQCQEMVSKLHQKGIRIVMDVVYNHIYDINSSSFERIVPGYYFRKRWDGSLSNGSWCGNDLNTTALMVRKYIKDMCIRWQWLYGIDGYRFDLMGIIDLDTINIVYQECYKNDNSFIVYGEGWNMDTALDKSLCAHQDNHDKLINISFFNDGFRDVLKGNSSNELVNDKGYLFGEMYQINNAMNYLTNTNRYSRVDQSINYFECHDNYTLYDKITISNDFEDEKIRNKRLLLSNFVCILAQGIPFIHSGQEFFRTKNGIPNTYNSSDEINALNWELKDNNIDYINELKKIIKIRKDNQCFRYDTKEDVDKYIKVENIDNSMIKYSLRQDCGEHEEIIVYINASNNKIKVKIDSQYSVLYGTMNYQETEEIEPVSMAIVGMKRMN